MTDDRFLRFAAGEGPVSDAVEAVLDATFDTARNVVDALLRQATALLLLASMLVGEVRSRFVSRSADRRLVSRATGRRSRPRSPDGYHVPACASWAESTSCSAIATSAGGRDGSPKRN